MDWLWSLFNNARMTGSHCRYEGIAKIAQDAYPPLLGELGFKPSSFSAISMQGGMIDKEKLSENTKHAMKVTWILHT